MEELNIHNKCILASLEANELESLCPYSDRLRVIVILEGNGKAMLDKVPYSYQKDSIFILRAQQNISFQTIGKNENVYDHFRFGTKISPERKTLRDNIFNYVWPD